MTTIAQPHDATCRCPQCCAPSGMGVDLYRPAQLRALGVAVLVPLPHPRMVVAEPTDRDTPVDWAASVAALRALPAAAPEPADEPDDEGTW